MLKNRGYQNNINNSDFLTVLVFEKRKFSKNKKLLINYLFYFENSDINYTCCFKFKIIITIIIFFFLIYNKF